MPKSASISAISERNFRVIPKDGRKNPEVSTHMASNGKAVMEADVYENPSLPNRTHEYMERFVYNNTYAAPQVKYVTTEIDPEIVWKIRSILFGLKKGRVCSLKAFINNVLAAHLEEYADVINQLKL